MTEAIKIRSDEEKSSVAGSLRVIICGACGRMGRVLRGVVDSGFRGASAAALVDTFGRTEEDGVSGQKILRDISEYTGDADCIIDFSHHSYTPALTEYAVRRKMPLVIATTGQTEDEIALLRDAAKSVPVFRSGNMSMGIALLVELAKKTASLFPEADVEIIERHHNRKADVPSGTALMLADAVRDAREDGEIVVGRHEAGKRARGEIGVHSLRMGNVVGVHEVIVATDSQIITLKHEAQDRSLFAEGAVAAAQFVTRQAPGMYDISDVLAQG